MLWDLKEEKTSSDLKEETLKKENTTNTMFLSLIPETSVQR